MCVWMTYPLLVFLVEDFIDAYQASSLDVHESDEVNIAPFLSVKVLVTAREIRSAIKSDIFIVFFIAI